MSVTMKFKGDKEIIAKIKLLEKKGGAELKQAMLRSAIYIEGQAKKNTPVLTGRLRASITHDVKSIGTKHSGRVGTDVHYAPHVEFGTIKMSAQPYLIPSLVQSASKILQFIKDAVARLK